MMQEKHIIVITDNENSEIVRMLSRHKVVPVTRRSIISALDLLRHTKTIAIIIDKENQNVDSLEFILNARDISPNVPIFVPEQFLHGENWNIIKEFNNIIFYHHENQLYQNELSKFIN